MKTSKPVKIKIDLLSFLSKIEESKVSTLSNKTQIIPDLNQIIIKKNKK